MKIKTGSAFVEIGYGINFWKGLSLYICPGTIPHRYNYISMRKLIQIFIAVEMYCTKIIK